MRPTTRDAYEFFHEGTVALAQVEAAGIRIDRDYLNKMIPHTEKRINRLERRLESSEVVKRWRRRFGQKYNPESAQQLGVVLFEEMKLNYTGEKEVDAKGKAKWSTEESVLQKVDHPFCKNYLKIKKLRKSKSTYLEGILREVDNDGYLHPSFNLVSGKEEGSKGGALSYRGSSSNPNFQNMPIRNPEMSKLIRPAFIAREGCRLAEVDFSQLEVRISACYNKDPALIRYVKDPSTCMHYDTACELFMLKREQIGKKTLRDSAKNQFVFPQFYGSYYPDCAAAIWDRIQDPRYVVEGSNVHILDHLRSKGIKKLGEVDDGGSPAPGTFMHKVKQVEDSFWNKRFKVYTKWKKDWYNKYLERGYFDLYTGFRCRGVYRRNQVINFPVQGAAFHCLLWAINRILAIFRKEKMASLIVGEIHDCILFDIPVKETQKALNIIERVMTKELLAHWKWITVPLEIEADLTPVGGSWDQKTQWVRNADNKWAPKQMAA